MPKDLRKQIKVKHLTKWLQLSQELVNEYDSDAEHILSKLTAKELRVVTTLVKGAYAKGYRDKVKDAA